MEHFESDLALGKKYERKYVNDYLQSEYEMIEYAPDKQFKDWDIKARKTRGSKVATTFEVKADKMACWTGNFFIESSCNGESSGIRASKADYWILYDIGHNDICYRIPLSELKQIISNLKKQMKKDNDFGKFCPNGGDGGRACGYKVSIFHNFLEYKI